MITEQSALWPLVVALDTAFLDDLLLSSKLAGEKIYTARLPLTTERKPLPYLTFTNPSERAFNLFARGGNKGTININIWAEDIVQGLSIWGDIRRIAGNKRLTLTGGNTQLDGRVHLLHMDRHPDDDKLIWGPIRYEFETWNL